jgi:hypothetical protein
MENAGKWQLVMFRNSVCTIPVNLILTECIAARTRTAIAISSICLTAEHPRHLERE